MRRNTKRKALLHSSLKRNSISGTRRRGPLAWALAAALAAAMAVFAVWGCVRLRDMWIEQCVVTDVSRQVTVTTGANIKPGLLLEQFGIAEGVNLARIDFAERRDAILAKIPNIRSLTVSRRLPDRVEIVAVEREPVARLNVRGGVRATGRVTDAEGVVFLRLNGTSLLPTIFETGTPTAVGKRLDGRSRAALSLVTAAQESGFSDLGVQSVDTSRRDSLHAILGDYTSLDVAWEGFDGPPTAASEAALRAQLTTLVQARRSSPGGVRKWNATIRGRAFGNTMEPIK